MEHLNCWLKIMMRNLGANIKSSSIENTGNYIGVVHISVMFWKRRNLRNIPLESIPFHNLETTYLKTPG